MTSREIVRASFEGRPRDHFPVAVPYSFLMHREHWQEITGEPPWTYHRWLYADPDAHVEGYRLLRRALPFDILEPVGAPTREERECVRVERRAEGCFVVNMRTGESRRVSEDLPHMEGGANEQRRVFTRRDVDEQVRPWRAEDAIARGVNDYRSKAVEELGKEVFILTGGVVGTFWHCTWYVGLTNRFMLLRDEPGLIEYLSSRLLEHAIEQVRVLAAAGGDAIYIDDATATCEMISRKDYERFSMPYVREIVREIHAHGMKAILIYFGGVADRVEQIASLGADGLIVETTMKNYVNDIGDVAARLDGKMCLFGNLDPVGVLWRGTEDRLREEVERQAAVGRRYGRFVLSTGSPVTPGTPLARIRRFIDLAHAAGR